METVVSSVGQRSRQEPATVHSVSFWRIKPVKRVSDNTTLTSLHGRETVDENIETIGRETNEKNVEMRLMFSSHKGYIGEIRTIVDELQDFFCKNTKKNHGEHETKL